MPKKTLNIKNCLSALLLFAGFLLGGEIALAAQNNPKLSPQQKKTVEQLRDQLVQTSENACSSCRETARFAVTVLSDLDPILVGRHVVFDKKWLYYVGAANPATRQQFVVWRNRMDQVYDRYKELIGKAPPNGEKVFIGLRSQKDFGVQSNGIPVGAHAKTEINVIEYSHDSPYIKRDLAQPGSWNATMMHELAHLFGAEMDWEVEVESFTELLIAYAMETIPEAMYVEASITTAGNQHRIRLCAQVFEDFFRNGNLDAFHTKSNTHGSTAYRLYLLGLVDIVGWETYKKVFRSYHDDTYTRTKIYDRSEDDRRAKAHEFFDRVAYFHDEARKWSPKSIPPVGQSLTGTQVLLSLPDGGALHQYLMVKTTPVKTIIPTGREKASEWSYTTTKPAAGWEKADFDASSWPKGHSGFGTAGTPNTTVRTTWQTDDIWVRKSFELAAEDATEPSHLVLDLYHDEDCEVYINGVKVLETKGYITDYRRFPIQNVGKTIRAGTNVIAIHCKNTWGGQYIDAGIFRLIP